MVVVDGRVVVVVLAATVVAGRPSCRRVVRRPGRRSRRAGGRRDRRRSGGRAVVAGTTARRRHRESRGTSGRPPGPGEATAPSVSGWPARGQSVAVGVGERLAADERDRRAERQALEGDRARRRRGDPEQRRRNPGGDDGARWTPGLVQRRQVGVERRDLPENRRPLPVVGNRPVRAEPALDDVDRAADPRRVAAPEATVHAEHRDEPEHPLGRRARGSPTPPRAASTARAASRWPVRCCGDPRDATAPDRETSVTCPSKRRHGNEPPGDRIGPDDHDRRATTMATSRSSSLRNSGGAGNQDATRNAARDRDSERRNVRDTRSPRATDRWPDPHVPIVLRHHRRLRAPCRSGDDRCSERLDDHRDVGARVKGLDDLLTGSAAGDAPPTCRRPSTRCASR